MEKKHSHHQFITLGGTFSRPKYTTRHLAALDFLLNVPMQKEASIRQAGMEYAAQLKKMEDGLDESGIGEQREEEEDEGESARELIISPSSIAHIQQDNSTQTEAAGKKLQGPIAPIGRFPPSLRYQMQKTSVQSVVYRQWEDSLLNKMNQKHQQLLSGDSSILDSRIFFSRARSYPSVVYSIIQFDAKEEKERQQKLKGDQKALKVYELPHRDWRGFSYKPLFKQMKEERAGDYFFERGFLYDPNSLDDPELLYGCHRYVLSRSAKTGPIISSIILYVNKKELKESLNEKFHDQHPNLPPTLTLSKIRKVKRDILNYCLKAEIELTTVAIAIICFERLCLKGLVSKINRRLTMAVCMILAIKFNETCSSILLRKVLDQLCDYFDKEWDLPRKQVFEAEFGVYVHLGFLLHLPYQHVYTVYTRLLALVNKSNRSYLKEEMLEVYLQDVMHLERMKEFYANALKEREQDEKEGEEGGLDGRREEDGGEKKPDKL